MWPWPLLVKGVWGGACNSRRILKGPKGTAVSWCLRDGVSPRREVGVHAEIS